MAGGQKKRSEVRSRGRRLEEKEQQEDKRGEQRNDSVDKGSNVEEQAENASLEG